LQADVFILKKFVLQITLPLPPPPPFPLSLLSVAVADPIPRAGQ
jgi:hypothetical protein